MNKLPELSEHQIQQLCINYLRAKGYYVLRLNSGKYSVGEGRSRRFIMGQEAGTPDILFIKDGKANFVEVKTGKNKLTFLQEHKIKELAEYGCKTLVVYSLDQLMEELQEMIL